jgi:hypothetical protein
MNATTELATINPFGQVTTQQRSAAAPAQTDQSRAIAEVQAAMMIARLNPRDPIAAVDRILNACSRPSLAEAAIYQYSRGGTDISGPSIRLAEAMAQQWGNIKTSVRELEQSQGVSVVQAIAWDLETGYQCDKVFHVPHVRHTKAGTKRLEDPRDIYELVANQAARRLRACILAVIPGDVTEAAVKQCELTLHTSADTSPEVMAKMMAAFAQFGVTREQIEAKIQRRLDAIQPAQVVTLKKIYASLRDGMSSPSDWFGAPGDAQPAGGSIEQIKSRVRREKAAAQTQQSAPTESVDTTTGEITEAPTQAAPAVTYAQVRDALERAQTDDERALAADMIRMVGDEAQRAELTDLFRSKAD